MWDADDVARSLRRYLAGTIATEDLGDDRFRIYDEVREVKDDDRPVAILELGELTVLRAREGTPHQGEVEYAYPVTVTAYPRFGETERDSGLAARTLRSHLTRWVTHGYPVQTVTGQNEWGDDQHRDWAGPFRAPLWDWAAVPVKGPDRGDVEDPHDVLWIPRESLAVNAVQDPDDRRRFTVLCEFRVTVESPGADGWQEGVPVTGFQPTFSGHGVLEP